MLLKACVYVHVLTSKATVCPLGGADRLISTLNCLCHVTSGSRFLETANSVKVIVIKLLLKDDSTFNPTFYHHCRYIILIKSYLIFYCFESLPPHLSNWQNIRDLSTVLNDILRYFSFYLSISIFCYFILHFRGKRAFTHYIYLV